MINNDAEKFIVQELRLARKRKKPTTFVIHVTSGIVQIMQAEMIIQSVEKHDIRHVANGANNR